MVAQDCPVADGPSLVERRGRRHTNNRATAGRTPMAGDVVRAIPVSVCGVMARIDCLRRHALGSIGSFDLSGLSDVSSREWSGRPCRCRTSRSSW